MAQNAPGKHFRTGITIFEAAEQFSNSEHVERLFAESRWPDGIVCPKCDSRNIHTRTNRPNQPYRCRGCRADFSVKTGTVMHGSNIPLTHWAMALYLMSTSLKGVSSMKLHRDLGITQKSAWYMAHRIREAWETNGGLFSGPVEVDETYVGGKEGNKHADKKLHAGRGPVGKTAVAGIRDRETNQIVTEAVEDTTKDTLQNFVEKNTTENAQVYSDEARAYQGLNRRHATVSHSVGEYVRGVVSTNGMESHWATLKRGINGTYYHISVKHLDRYATEFEGRHNNRTLDTADQIKGLIAGMDGKHLSYQDLISD